MQLYFSRFHCSKLWHYLRPLTCLASLFLIAPCVADDSKNGPILGEPAWDSPFHKEQILATLKLADYPQESVVLARFRDIDPAVVTVVQKAGRTNNKARQIGISRYWNIEGEGEKITSKNLRWKTSATGELVSQLKVSSPGARALRVALKLDQIPSGLELRVMGSEEPAKIVASKAAAIRQQLNEKVYWTAVTDGDTQTIEISLSPDSAAKDLFLEVEAVSHLLAASSTQFRLVKALGDADFCQQDIACVNNPSAGFLNASKAVAKMLFTKPDGTYVCTGTLLNDTDPATQIPYFFTANHCIDSQSIAKTLNTYWFFEAPACGSSSNPTTTVSLNGGAQLLYGQKAADVALLKLNDTPPVGAFFAGFDPGKIPGNTKATGIHHPRGDVKKVSLGTINRQILVTDQQQSFNEVSWNTGTTETGSSGSALFTIDSSGNYLLRGGLLGGAAACSNSGQSVNAGNSDYFSRLDLAYDSIKQYLAPTGGPITSAVDYTGMWYDPNENGWGLSFVKGSSGALVAVWYTYNATRQPAWYILQNAKWVNSTVYTGDLYQFTGPAYNEIFNSNLVSFQKVGIATFTFNSPTGATFQYALNGVVQTKSIQRLEF